MDVLCCIDKVGSPVNPNCATIFFVVSSLAFFSCQRCCSYSDLICFARAMFVCLRFFSLEPLFFLAACPGHLGFHRFFGPELFTGALFGRVLCWFIACLWFDLFFFEAPGFVVVWRSSPLWHVFLMVLLCYLLFQLVTFVFQPCIFANHVYRILFG